MADKIFVFKLTAFDYPHQDFFERSGLPEVTQFEAVAHVGVSTGFGNFLEVLLALPALLFSDSLQLRFGGADLLEIRFPGGELYRFSGRSCRA
jgi:hypothetical protein